MVNRYISFAARGTAALWHLLGSLLVASLAGTLVFWVWYPHPYQELAGGRELFWLVIIVDVITGPLLTMVVFDTHKPRRELIRDVALVVCIQLCALGYGVWTVWEARPLFLVAEIDRFKVITSPALAENALSQLNNISPPSVLQGPIVVAIRTSKNEEERQRILFESLQGGRDYGERPEFYVPYAGGDALRSLERAKPVSDLLKKIPDAAAAIEVMVAKTHSDANTLKYLPIVARRAWVAILDSNGAVIGFIPGDGF